MILARPKRREGGRMARRSARDGRKNLGESFEPTQETCDTVRRIEGVDELTDL